MAQPGWRDQSKKITYTIKNNEDSIIDFKNNKEYSIMINGVMYFNKSIPTIDFVPTIINGNKFSYLIQINDCKIQLPMKEYWKQNKNPSISILKKKDTMLLAGFSNITIQFEKGYFYFPSWAGVLLSAENSFKMKGSISLKHFKNQSFFSVPKKIFYHKSIYENDHYTENKADSFVQKRYIEKNIKYSLHKKNIIQINPLPFFTTNTMSNVSFATDNKNIFYGKQEFSYDEGNTYYSKAFFTLLDKEKLTIENWQVNKNIFSYYEGKFWLDSFSNKMHIIVGERDTVYNRQFNWDDSIYPIKNVMYQSSNYGKTWETDTILNTLVNYNFNELEILDNEYYLGYKRDEQEVHRKLVGRYYLIKNLQIVDSLITPDSIYYNSNYNNYKFDKINNTLVNLGPWGVDENNYKKPFVNPQIVRQNKEWNFKLNIDSVGSNSAYQNYLSTKYVDKKKYKNFEIISDGILLLKNNTSTLKINNYKQIIENENNIFVFLDYGLLVSFDAGKEWLFLPIKTTEYEERADIVDIDKKNIISFYKLCNLKKYEVIFEPIK